jgi:truncated hemoglobin YjbI
MMKHSKVKSPTRAELAKLVQEIGGESALFGILKDFYTRMSKDLMIGFFFEKHDLGAISKMQGQFLLNAAGIAKSYPGRGPSTAHLAMPPILSGHFDRRLVILRETLQEHLLNEAQQNLWVRFEESFRSVVVSG